jgi:hypothetical protein
VSYSQLDGAQLVHTAARLCNRIRERFPAADLAQVATALLQIAEQHAARSAAILRPAYLLRLWSWLLLAVGLAGLWLLFASIRWRPDGEWKLDQALQSLDSGLSMAFYLGAGAVYLASIELRRKRRRCLEALHELRALAHIVDLHQLGKDPDRALHPGPDTPSSPERPLSPFLLSRYLDYCVEMLALIGKVAALYGQRFPDPQAIDAVDDIEDLTSGLAGKISNKIMVLQAHGATVPIAAEVRP